MSTNPSACGVSIKWLSLIVLTLQNSALTVLLHYSRTRAEPYSAAAAVLAIEILKGMLSALMASYNIIKDDRLSSSRPPSSDGLVSLALNIARVQFREVFSADCWKLGIPAILYVIQNNLMFIAGSNLDVATFQVSYQMKILTTALFSVILLNKRLNGAKWLSLALLAVGVGIVQVQATLALNSTDPLITHRINPIKGFTAVSVACITSGLAGVYFELVLKSSPADLWIRNVQLSLFSLIPAFTATLWLDESLIDAPLFANFGVWAWSVVMMQVLGGLVTAVVIKFADNIIKGFATSMAIVLSSLAGIILFAYPLTFLFVLGSSLVLSATWMYNRPDTSTISRSPSSILLSSSTLSIEVEREYVDDKPAITMSWSPPKS